MIFVVYTIKNKLQDTALITHRLYRRCWFNSCICETKYKTFSNTAILVCLPKDLKPQFIFKQRYFKRNIGRIAVSCSTSSHE